MTALKTRTDQASRFATAAALILLSPLAGCDLLGGDKAKDSAGQAAAAEGDASAGGAQAAGAAAAPVGAGAGDPAAGANGEAAPAAGAAAASGASVAWSATASAAPTAILVSKNGDIVALLPEAISGYSGGKEAWTEEGPHSELIRLQDGSVLTTTAEKIFALDPASGALVFEAAIPLPRDAAPTKRGKPVAPPPVVAAASLGSQVLVALADARFFVIDPPACTKKQAACMRAAGALDGEFLEPSAGLAVAADGTRFLREEDALRAFNATLDLEFALVAHKHIVGISTSSEARLALSFGGEIALIDTNKCRGRAEVRLGRGFASSGPRGCVVWRYGGDLDNTLPAVVDSTGVAANGNHRLQLVMRGTDSWKSPLGSLGPVTLGEGGELYTATVEEPDEQSPTISLSAVRADKGTLLWSAALPFEIEAGAVVVSDSLRTDWQPGWVAVAYDQELAVVSVPRVAAEG